MNRKHLVLQKRDYALLKALSDYRYLSTSQLRNKFFTNGPFIYRRLKKLTDYGLITRIQREIVGQASELIHALTPEGAKQLGAHLSVPTHDLTTHRKASRQLLEHELMLNEFRLAFEKSTERQNGLSILQWDTKYRIHLAGKKILIPDVYVILSTPKGNTHFFVEIDRFTESPSKVFRKKLHTYAQYHSTGRFTEECHAKAFRLLTITLHEHALTTLMRVCSTVHPHPLFWFSYQTKIQGKDVLTDNIWLRLDHPQKHTSLYSPA